MIGVLLENPKYPHNVGAVLRACAAFGAKTLSWTGERVPIDGDERLPREERYRNYKRDVNFAPYKESVRRYLQQAGLDHFTPVAVEVRNESESLVLFEHPENAIYVFGPEDGSLSGNALSICHRFIHIPSHYALNLGAAVNIVLYDRRAKRQMAGLEPIRSLDEMLAAPVLAIPGFGD